MKSRTWLLVAPIALVACGSGRNYDNPPPEITPLETVSTTTVPPTTTTVFVPTTAPTTVAPPTQPPPPPTAPHTNAPEPTAPPTPRPTEATVPTTPVETTGEVYTVVGGDTLFGISRKLGVSLEALLAANGMTQSSVIHPGQQLQIPVGGEVPSTNAPSPPSPTAPPATNAPAPTAPPQPQPTSGGDPAPPPAPTTTFPAPPGAVQPSNVTASCQAPDSEEADRTPISFQPSNVLDRNPATAWRCAAPAVGETLTFTLGGDTHLTSVGLIGGYVKVDTQTLVDRFLQNHRVRQVIWRFSDGTSVTQDLADSRDMQTIAVNVTTNTVTLEIVSTYPPAPLEGQGPGREMVPVAEVQFIGG